MKRALPGQDQAGTGYKNQQELKYLTLQLQLHDVVHIQQGGWMESSLKRLGRQMMLNSVFRGKVRIVVIQHLAR